MSQPRNADPMTEAPDAPDAATGPEAGLLLGRPLSARSVLASTLLGIDPPWLPTRLLVRSGELFGIAEGTTRVAISRMLTAGELMPDRDGYHLAGPLLARQARQQASRMAEQKPWDGSWMMTVVPGNRRSPAARAELREALRRLKLAELREGVWLRPDNLAHGRSPEASALVSAQCRVFDGVRPSGDAVDLAELWDLDGWASGAVRLRALMEPLASRLDDGDTGALADGFLLSAAVLRHLLADPLLPRVLLPDGWPGDALRHDYDRYDRAFKTAWRDWFREQHPLA
jgi:phenylacetic acid degradation operon negative regulatory protein